MALPVIYSSGTVSVTNGETTVTGSSTLWGDDAIMAGDLFCDPAQPLVPPQRVASVTDDGELELWAPWPGTTMSADAYEIRFVGIIERSTAQTRRLLEQLSVVRANGQGRFFRFSDTTADADPGPGLLRLNHADPTLATAAYIDVLDANGASLAGEIDSWDDSSSLIKGRLWLTSIVSPSSFRAYAVTGSVVDGTGYRKLTLTHVGGSGGFAADEELMVAFARTGDMGDGYATDATVAGPSELTALESEDPGYRVFVTDLETEFGAYSGRSGVVELIAGPDWEVVAVYTGPQGAASTVPGPTGPAGIVWQGTYDGGTAYVANDGVLYNGSSWRALGVTTGNAPPTLPTTSNTWWALVARQGIDGAGTVNSVAAGAGLAVDNTDPTAPEVSLDIASLDAASTLDGTELLHVVQDGNSRKATVGDVRGVRAPTQAVRAATTASITISTALNNGDSLDGVSLESGDLVLVKDQTDAEENGIYVVGTTPARSTDFDAWEKFFGLEVVVVEGTRNGVTSWISAAPKAGTLDTTDLTFKRQRSSPIVVLADGDFSNSAGLDILDLTAQDLMIEVVLSGVRPATDNAWLSVRVSSNNGSSFDATGYYRSGAVFTTGNAVAGDGGSLAATEIRVSSTLLNNASIGGHSGTIRFFNPTDANTRTRLTATGNSLRSGGTVGDTTVYSGERAASQADNALRIFLSSGNIASGHYTVYSYRGG